MKRWLVVGILSVLALTLGGTGWSATPKDTLVVGVTSDIHLLDPAVSSDNFD